MGEISQAFKISTVVPQKVIVCNQSTLQSIDLTMPSTLAVIIDGEGDIFGQLEELTSSEPVLEKVAIVAVLGTCTYVRIYSCSIFNIAHYVCIRLTMWIKVI